MRYPRIAVLALIGLTCLAAGTASYGWGGNPREAAVYQNGVPALNDGKTPYVLTVRDVPVDGFWSITAGWNYVVRMYQPRKQVVDGTWKFPEAQPAS